MTNGRCVSTTLLQSQCQGMRLSKADQCNQTSEFCCFQASSHCSPQSEPTVKDGTCINISQLTDQCRTGRFSESVGCNPDQFCCFDKTPSASNNNSVVTIKITLPTQLKQAEPCSPTSDPSAIGQCMPISQLAISCQGKQMSKSVNCTNPTDFCCFSRTPTVKTPCNPNSNLDSVGFCADQTQLSNQCQNLRFSKSANCSQAGHFCCFANQLQTSPRNLCRPESEPTSQGICLLPADLASECRRGQRAAKSSDCTTRNQWCCFSGTTGQLASQIKDSLATGPIVSGSALSESTTGMINCTEWYTTPKRKLTIFLWCDR